MLRKLTLAFVAAATLGAALIPSAASANGIIAKEKMRMTDQHDGKHDGRHRHSLHFFGGPIYYGGPVYASNYDFDPCYVRRLVWTPYGYKYRLVNQCD